MSDTLRDKFQALSDEWRSRGNQPKYDEEVVLNPIEKFTEMQAAQAEMRYILGGKLDNGEERMLAACIATTGRRIGSRELADAIAKEARNRKNAAYAAAAALSGFGR